MDSVLGTGQWLISDWLTLTIVSIVFSVLGRARVPPIREITIPCLELSGAVVSVQRELDTRLDRCYILVQFFVCTKMHKKRKEAFPYIRVKSPYHYS